MATDAEVTAALNTFINKVPQFEADADLARQIVQGDSNTTVSTENGPVDSFAKVLSSLATALPHSFPFIDSGLAVSFSASNAFTVDGNQQRSGDQGTFFVGQRLQLRDGSSIVDYANVEDVGVAGGTTTVTLDRTAMTANVDAVYKGLDDPNTAVSSVAYRILDGETGVFDDTYPYWDIRRWIDPDDNDHQSSIQAALDSVASTFKLLVFDGSEYPISARVEVNDDIRIVGNGSTLSGATQLLRGGEISDSGSGLAVSLTEGDDTFTVPGGVDVAVGDVVHLYTDADRITSYKNGHWAKIIGLEAGTARMDRGPADTFSADNMSVWPGSKVEIDGLIFDNSAATSVDFFGSAELRGDEINITNCEFIGSDNATMGLYIKAVKSVVTKNAAHGYINDPGLSGGGRIGYGLVVNGGDLNVAYNRVWDCKVCIASNERNIQSTMVRYFGNLCFQDPSKADTNSAEGSDWFTALFDVHGNADHFIMDSNIGFGAGDMIAARGRSGQIINNYLVALDAEDGSNAIRSFDAQHKEGFVVANNRVSYPSDVDGCYFVALNGMEDNNEGVRIEGNRVVNANILLKGADYRNTHIRDNDIVVAADEKGIALNENLDDPIDFTDLWIENNRFDQDNNDDTIACYAGDYTNVHITGNRFIGTGGVGSTLVDFASGDINGLWIKDNQGDFDGTAIEIGADNLNNAHISGNEIRYGVADNGAAFVVALWLNATNQSNVNVYRNRFELVDDANNTNTAGIQIENENDCRIDFNVLSEAITDNSGDFTYIPRGNVFLNSSATAWKGVKLYEDGRIGLVNDAAPTSETWAVGDRVDDEAPSAGGTIGWVCVSAGEPGTWEAWGAIEDTA